ncbi:MAG: glycosyltransferase family 4 protein [Opitutaceae bacterium]|nr:glycosyltransferase family 4 protein [Opitutaceae bacterium]
MTLLVLAQTPPPLHGQSLMVQTLVDNWARFAGPHRLLHVNLALSRDTADIGRLQWGKLGSLKAARSTALSALRDAPGAVLYYVPAPGKLSAVVRDLLLLPALRRTGVPLVLHWHAGGLAAWTRRFPILRPALNRALGRASLSIVPSSCVRLDADTFAPSAVAVIPNGIADPFPSGQPPTGDKGPCRILFLGACTKEKGILDLASAFSQWATRKPGRYELLVAGAFDSARTEAEFDLRIRPVSRSVRRLGVVKDDTKAAALASADVVCLPTHYPHEVQPLVAIEALAADKKVVATQWRGLPELLAGTVHTLADPSNIESLAAALEEVCRQAPPGGMNRQCFLSRFTLELHLKEMSAALVPLLESAAQASRR